MTPEQVSLVRTSFAQVAPMRKAAAALFYARLFELDPQLRPMFSADLERQGDKLMTALAMVVRALDDLEPLLDYVDELARRHRGYGVRKAHYATVGQALIWTLQQGLGEAFTPQVREAWTAAYAALSGRMIAAGYAEAA